MPNIRGKKGQIQIEEGLGKNFYMDGHLVMKAIHWIVFTYIAKLSSYLCQQLLAKIKVITVTDTTIII